MENKLRKVMVEHLNLKLKEEKSSLCYKESMTDGPIITFDLTINDKYIDQDTKQMIHTTKEFETMVREFFKKYGVSNTGYSNTVSTLVCWEGQLIAEETNE